MTREDYLKEKIKEQGTQREFAAKIGMPPSTLFSILRNVGGASIDNIIKICKGLNIKPDELAEIGEEITIPSETKGYYTNSEAAEFAEYLRTRPGARMLFFCCKRYVKRGDGRNSQIHRVLKI